MTPFLDEGVNGAGDGGLARFWQPIEAAASSLATAPAQNLPAAIAGLVHLLAGDLIPRLRAEESVLLPLVLAEQQPSSPVGLNHADVSRLAETISTFALRLSVSDVGRVHRTASTLLTVLGVQRAAEARLVALVRTLPAADRGGTMLGDRLEQQAQASRASQFFLSPADRLPTEAWVLRDNPKPARLEGVAQDMTSAVADLVAILESA